MFGNSNLQRGSSAVTFALGCALLSGVGTLTGCSDVASTLEQARTDGGVAPASDAARITRLSPLRRAPTQPSTDAGSAALPADTDASDAAAIASPAIADAALPMRPALPENPACNDDVIPSAEADAGGVDAGTPPITYSTETSAPSDAAPPPIDAALPPTVGGPKRCPARLYEGFRYGSGDAFWLGTQAKTYAQVTGLGYLVFGAEGSAELRYRTEALVSIAPSGVFQDEYGQALLALADTEAGEPPCLAPLMAPMFNAPVATSLVKITANLDRDATLIPAPWDERDPSATSNYSTSFWLLDAQGAQRTLEVYFRKVDNDVWSYHVLAAGEDLAGGTPGMVTQLSEGSLSFATFGALWDAEVPAFSVDFLNATPGQTIQLWFGDDLVHGGGTIFNGITQFGGPSFVTKLEADGYPAGIGSEFDISPDGNVTVIFGSGVRLELGTLALARFPVERALEANDDGTWSETLESGTPEFAVPETPGRGRIE